MPGNERVSRLLKIIIQKPGNDACADCGAPGKLKCDADVITCYVITKNLLA